MTFINNFFQNNSPIFAFPTMNYCDIWPMNNFNCISEMPTFTFTQSFFNNTNIFSSTTSFNWNIGDTFTSTISTKTQKNTLLSRPSTLSSTKNIQWWKDLGYNPQKGKELMDFMRPRATGFKGNCVGVVREGINNVYYNGEKHYKQFGKACNVGNDFLSKDSHFKKITGIELASINTKDIPEGVIIIYGPGYSTKHPECGHGEVSDGNGRGYSDGITHIKNCGKQTIKELWIPV